MMEKSTPYRFDDAMMRRFHRAEKLLREYDSIPAEDAQARDVLLSELFAEKGENVLILAGFHCEFGDNIRLGHDVVINYNCFLMDNTEITIGNHVLIGPNVGIYTVNHAIYPEERAAGWCVNAPVSIGDRVWLGGNATILPGVTIGEGSIIAAGSVVTKNIPANVIAAGSPCRVLRPITEADRLGG